MAAVLPGFLATGALAGWSTDPSQSVVVCDAPGDQTFVRGASDGAGGAIFAWRDDRAGVSSTDVYAQRVDGYGNVLWDSLGVPVDTSASVQQNIHIASDGAGGAYVLWVDQGVYPNAIMLARLDGNGNAVWPASRQLSTTVYDANVGSYLTVLAPDGSGGAIATWSDVAYNVYAQRVDAAGNFLWGPGAAAVAVSGGAHFFPRLAPDGSGGALVAWNDLRAVDRDIYAQKLDAGGNPVWTVNGVPVCTASGEQRDPVVACDGDGGAIIAWLDRRTGCDTYAQRLNASGIPRWTADGILVGPNGFICTLETPAIAPDGANGAILTWADQLGFGIQAQRVDSTGTFLWGASPLNVCAASGSQSLPEVVVDAQGGAVIGWQDRRSLSVTDVYAQSLDGSGAPQWTADGDTVSWLTGDSVNIDLVPAAPGQAIVVFEDHVGGATGSDIHAQMMQPNVLLAVPDPSGYEAFALKVAPNPSSRGAQLTLTLAHASNVTLTIFDAAGRRVRTLAEDRLPAGTHVIRWDGLRRNGGAARPGLYFARLAADGDVRLARVVVLAE